MATIYEVAARAGVSPATVSRVFNGARVSADKTERVRRAAADLAFTPNRAARTLRRRNSEVIALIIPDIGNPYYTEMARGVGDVARESGYSVVLCNTDERGDHESGFLQIALAEHMAGVIIAPASERTDLSPVLEAGRAIVAVDRTSTFAVDGVTMANREACRNATDHLLEQGFRRIACVTGPAAVETAVERVEGWREAVRSTTGKDPDPQLLCHSTFRVDGGRDAMERLLTLPEPPDAVVAANNLMGVGILQLLNERRLAPPAIGVAVVGSLPFTTMSPRAVTVVRLPAREMGETAAKLLIQRIDGDDEPQRTVVLQHTVEPAIVSGDDSAPALTPTR
ncbi:LacI family DNA-binding transcriptional regulator [Microlunatus soli]|uniref:Transcriptional regulator, LacI family n=1 Tax=Microlunatus soli TaxID=630515 RepID=A0A1H2A7W8_9ACTN|nr:LacI family DNA-binding transcriptional regulator [Microlunatus soli]SDT42060.1 transcriptional regulator, LacI family [Microlunatus soli]